MLENQPALKYFALTCLAIGVSGAWWMFVKSWHGRRIRGQPIGTVVCRHPARLIGLFGGVLLVSCSVLFAILRQWMQSALAFSMSLYGLLPSTGGIQFYRNGLWLYWHLVQWNQIKFYRWAEDGVLTLQIKGGFTPMTVTIPHSDRSEIAALLSQNIRDTTEQPHALERAIEPVSNGESSPHAQ